MSNNLYCVLDGVAGISGDVFEAPNDAFVKRTFTRLFTERQSPFTPSSDLSVYCIGEVRRDEKFPVVLNFDVPRCVLRGCDLNYDSVEVDNA